jgi:hypothetical protein
VLPFTTILSIVSTTAIVTGVIFAALQFRQYKRLRARESAIHLLHTAQTREFLEAIEIVFELPEGLTKTELEERLGEKIGGVLVMFGTFESFGVLVYRREIELEIIEDFFQGAIILAGRKFRLYIEEVRKLSGRESYYEWFQWLSDQVEKRENITPKVPAFLAHKDWSPI